MTEAASNQYLVTLAQFASNATLSTLSDLARERSRWIIADCIPVVAAGMQQPDMKALVEKHLAKAAPGGCWVLGTGRRAAAFDAALLNGTAGTGLELDEGNLFVNGGHPGIQVVPAAVAAAQDLGSTGADLELAVALGYEISSRVYRSAQPRVSLHPHGTFGVMGAAIAVAKLKGFSAAQMLHVINCSATMAMASSRNAILEGATVRNIFTGHSGYMGLMAAQLVECGFTGEADSPSQIWGRLLSDTFEPARVVEDLGSEWLITRNYFKLHPMGRYAHSAIDALEDLLARVPGGRLDIDRVARIEVRAYWRATLLDEKNVRTTFASRFSIPFAMGTILFNGRSGLKSFDEAAVANPKIQALAQLVEISEDTSFTARYPDEQPVDLTITMRDGTVHEGHCVVTKGEPANPHKPDEVKAKFFELGESVWSREVTRSLFEGLMQLETVPDFRAFAQGYTL
jgi:2-methylcitrate dehydratase PrpD